MKKCLLCLLTAIGVMIVFIFLITIFILSISSSEIRVADNSLLRIRIGGPIPEYVRPSDWDDLLEQERPLSMHDIRTGLERAASDSRIDAVVLSVSGAQLDIGQAMQIVGMINRFKESSEKQIYAFILGGSRIDYLIASAANVVYMQPEGTLILNPVQGSVDFYADMFKLAGIQADFIAVGDYKSAPDMFTKTGLTPANREQITHLLKSYQTTMDSTIRAHRSLTNARMDSIWQTGWLDAQDAKRMNLVDEIRHWDEFDELFDESNYISLRRYRDAADPVSGRSGRIAVIYMEGAVMTGGDTEDITGSQSFGSSRVIRNLRSAVKRSSIDGIILRIQSPGGSALASDLIWREVHQARQQKPVFVSIGGVAASGGYYIAMAGDSVFADPSSVVGSIGVFLGKFSIGELKAKKLDIRTENIRLPNQPDLSFFNEDRPFTSTERQILTRNLERFYNRFVEKVAADRNLSIAEVRQLAGGRVWTGTDAKRLGLIDGFGNLEDVIQILTKRLNKRRPSVTVYPGKSSLFADNATSRLLQLSDPPSPVTRLRNELSRLNDVRVWAINPLQLRLD